MSVREAHGKICAKYDPKKINKNQHRFLSKISRSILALFLQPTKNDQNHVPVQPSLEIGHF
jgi:hypothetical protein